MKPLRKDLQGLIRSKVREAKEANEAAKEAKAANPHSFKGGGRRPSYHLTKGTSPEPLKTQEIAPPASML